MQTQWAVSVNLGKTKPYRRFAVALRGTCKRACEAAKKYATNGWKGVQVDKIDTPEKLEAAEMQIERVEDWGSDHEIRE
jgi:hypothetical protein